MAGGVEFHRDVAEPDLLAIANRLRGAGEIVAIAQPHHVERLLRRQHRAVAGPRMVGMAMGDDRALDRADGIDMEATRLAAETGGSWQQDVLGTHPAYIGNVAAMFSRLTRPLTRAFISRKSAAFHAGPAPGHDDMVP